MKDNSELEELYEEISFRDRIATVDEHGKRNWIYPKKPSGRFFRMRTYVSWLLLGFFFLSPLIQINGEQLLLLNVLERKFVLFGVTFQPQDFYLFGLVMIASIVAIFLFTAVYGRIFCGWICPQTIFMEMVFRKIEYLIEGDAKQQRALNAQPWRIQKILKKSSKIAVFYGLSFLISNVFLAYIIGLDQLSVFVSEPLSEHLEVFTAVVLFSGAFFFVFFWFREQACTLVCPYGRLQSVLLDENSIVISYDFVRGEARKHFRRDDKRSDAGHCVDCHQCVLVCPTGIDIRNGTQLECVNCTACIDACDNVMDKVGYPRGLIRYASHTAIASGDSRIVTPRVIGYSGVLLALSAVIVFMFFARNEIETTVLRSPGTVFQIQDNQEVRNLFIMKVLNKTNSDVTLNAKLAGLHGTIAIVGHSHIRVPANGIAESAFFIDIPFSELQGVKTPVTIHLYSGEQLLERVETMFIGPSSAP